VKRSVSPLLRITWAVLALGLAGTWSLMVQGGSPTKPIWWIGALPLSAWVALPFGFIALAARWMSASRAARWVHLLAATLLSAIVVRMMLVAFLFSFQPPSAGVMIFLAFYQGIGYVPFLILAIWLQRHQVAAGGAGRAPHLPG